MRYAVIKDRIVQNVIEAPDGWVVDGHSLVASDTANPDDTYDGGSRKFTPAVVPDPEPTLREQYGSASTLSEKIEVIARRLDLLPVELPPMIP